MSPFWRRKPLHERLAEQGGLVGSGEPRRSPWDELVGAHGLARPRRWDAVVAAEAPALPGDELEFVVLADGTILVEADLPDEALSPVADALEQAVTPPYRVQAVRRGGDVWAAAALRIQVVEFDEDPGGDEVELAVADGERTLRVDGAHAFGGIPALERLLDGDGVVHAERLDDALWEVRVNRL